MLFYLDPRFYYPSAAVGGRERAVRGVLDLATRFGPLCGNVTFYPLPKGDPGLLREEEQLVWWSSSPGRRASAQIERQVRYVSLEMGKEDTVEEEIEEHVQTV